MFNVAYGKFLHPTIHPSCMILFRNLPKKTNLLSSNLTILMAFHQMAKIRKLARNSHSARNQQNGTVFPEVFRVPVWTFDGCSHGTLLLNPTGTRIGLNPRTGGDRNGPILDDRIRLGGDVRTSIKKQFSGKTPPRRDEKNSFGLSSPIFAPPYHSKWVGLKNRCCADARQAQVGVLTRLELPGSWQRHGNLNSVTVLVPQYLSSAAHTSISHDHKPHDHCCYPRGCRNNDIDFDGCAFLRNVNENRYQKGCRKSDVESCEDFEYEASYDTKR